MIREIGDLRYISFEIACSCNMERKHTFCPAGYVHREGTPATDEEICNFAHYMLVYGFSGEFAWHYYCEPLMDKERIQRLMDMISYERFSLWTNGALLTESDIPWLSKHTSIVVTLHDTEDRPRLESLLRGLPQAQICTAEYDDRLSIYSANHGPMYADCIRPSKIEMPIDYCGNIHLCCGDWIGEVPIGNIREPVSAALQWEVAGNLTRNLSICRRCVSLHKGPYAPCKKSQST
jgi:hypothetical protein